ncbi:MAG: hypothetical protein KDD40_08715, partial [Bdellovibrionales bacterium]|nr:hypothetical protein [Bdellovibrionales bacterium]
MKKWALLTCDDMSAYVSDEDSLDKKMSEILGTQTHWHSWTAPVDWSTYELAILRTTWDYTTQREKFLNKLKSMQDNGVNLCNSYEVVAWNSHKSYLLDLAAQGVAIIKTLPLGELSAKTIFQQSSSWDSSQVILKPFVGAASQGLKIYANNLEGIESLLSQVNGQQGQWFLQPFHSEIAQGEISLIFFNKKFSHGLLKRPKVGDFRSQEEFGSEILSYPPDSTEISFAENILQKISEDL